MTQEQTFTVGLDGRLVATLTLPHALAAVNDAPIALLTNSGVISRVGPHRLNVRIARWLAARGTASIRFDLSGVGDSRRAPGTRPQIEQWVADTLQVMDWAARRFGNDAFFMVGFCSGAEVAYRTAMVDARLRGLVLWDMFAYPTPKSRRLALMFRLRRAGVAGVAIKAAGRARRLLGAPVPPAQKPQQLQALEPHQPPPLERLAADLQTLVERGTQVKVMFCGGEPEWYSYPGAVPRVHGRLSGRRAECPVRMPRGERPSAHAARVARRVRRQPPALVRRRPDAEHRAPAAFGPCGLNVNPALSVWLDLCRVIAAGVVFVGHARGLEVAPTALAAHWHRTAEDAVIAFFVISGYVIAWSTQRPGTRMLDFVEARASRVFSVAIPAVLATLAIDQFGMRLDSSLYDPDWQYPKLWFYLPFHWSFLGGTWLGPIDPFSMASYWSLPYEVWYYALFGCATLLRGRARTAGIIATLAVMGPRMWLLLPCWWLGVWVYRRLESAAPPRLAIAALMMTGSVCAYFAFVAFGVRDGLDAASQAGYAMANAGMPQPFRPGGSAHPLADYVVALLFATFIVGCAGCRIAFGDRLAALVRTLADYSFSFYLLHYPLLVLFRAAGWHAVDWDGFAAVVAITLVGTWLLGQVGERRRSWYRRGVRHALDGAVVLTARWRATVADRPMTSK